jgi:hypothetical protein
MALVGGEQAVESFAVPEREPHCPWVSRRRRVEDRHAPAMALHALTAPTRRVELVVARQPHSRCLTQWHEQREVLAATGQV